MYLYRYFIRMIRLVCSMLLFAAAILSCDIAELDFHGKECEASILVTIDGPDDIYTRSSVGGTDAIQKFENSMNNMTLFQFSADGRLYRSYYFPSLQGNLSIQGRSGKTYTFKAVMNMGDVTGWMHPGDLMDCLADMTYEYGELPDPMVGCPMSCLDASVTMIPKGGTLTLVFTRLMSRYDLRIDLSHLSHGSFEINSLELLQAPSFLRPLARSSHAICDDEVTSGDYATVDNIKALSQGSFVPFFVLENAQGTLLSGNTDPWAKVPSSIGSHGSTCTYVELTGTYRDRTGLLQSSCTYRMFLGENNTTNFDVLRGTHHDLTLIISDDGFLKASWKAERHIISDARELRFVPDAYVVGYGGPERVTLAGDDGCSYSLSSNLSSAGVVFDSSTMTLSQTVKLSSDVQGTLTAMSWDRVLTATCQVTAKRYRPEYVLYCVCDYQWDYDEDQVGEVTENTLTEWVYFEAVTSSGEKLQCQFRIAGYPGCEEYMERYELVTEGVNRGPGPADMPERQLSPSVLKGYRLYVKVDGEETSPSWDQVTFKRY